MAGDVRVPNSAGLESPTVTVEAWVSATAPGTSAYVLAKGASGPTAASYALYTGATGGLPFYVSDGAGYVESPAAGAGVWDGEWHHVVGTHDGATVRLYVDGVEIGEGTATDLQIGYGLPTGNDLFTGSYQGDIALPFAGLIDEPAVYNRAHGPSEVVARYSGVSTPGGVVVNLPLGTASGSAGGVARVRNVVGSPGDDPLVGGATDYDLDADALLAIQAVWTRRDDDYATRVANLRSGSVDAPALLGTTAVRSGGGHTLTGGAGRDFFYANIALDLFDTDPPTEDFEPVFVG